MKKNIVVQGWMVAVTVFVLLYGGIYLTIGTGHWTSERAAEPIKLESGEYDPADIRGSYAFAEVEEFFGVPVTLLFDAFKIPEERRTNQFLIKDMEGLFEPVILEGEEIEVGTDLVRVFTSLYTDLPYQSDETTHLPEGLVNALIAENKLSEEQQAYWEAHTFPLISAGEAAAEETSTSAEGEQAVEQSEAATVEIKGRTTMGELLDLGLTKEQFQEITGFEMPGAAVKMKDFVDSNGLDMETLKTKMLELLAPPEAAPVSEEAPPPPAPETPATEGEASSASSQIEILGSTTVGAVFELGLTQEQFEEISGVAVPEETAMKLKDFAEANGLDMETLKTKLLEALQQE